MDETRKSLDALGLEFRTDKSSALHDYLNFYERYLAGWRDRAVTVLEVGVLRGASLAVWEAYFPRGKIVGADIDPNTLRLARDRVAVELVDQSSLEDLVRLGMKHGPFDVVVEDGSHFWEHQITSLRTLFPFVKDGGLYIVEDLHTNYGELATDYRGVASRSCMDYLKRLADLRVGDLMLDISQEEDAFLRTYGRAMRAITFYRRACLIEKSLPTDNEPDAASPFVAISDAGRHVGVKLVAHIGHVGDRMSQIGCLRPQQESHRIQGFTITVPHDRVGLQYSALLAGGEWSDWAEEGTYVGTRGRGEDLRGFAVKVPEAARARFEVQALGMFVGEPELVSAGDGDACVSRAGSLPLGGMQVLVRAREE